jgi:hypothetical protein
MGYPRHHQTPTSAERERRITGDAAPPPARAADASDLGRLPSAIKRASRGFATVRLGKTAYTPFAKWADRTAANRFLQSVVDAVTSAHGTSALAGDPQ